MGAAGGDLVERWVARVHLEVMKIPVTCTKEWGCPMEPGALNKFSR